MASQSMTVVSTDRLDDIYRQFMVVKSKPQEFTILYKMLGNLLQGLGYKTEEMEPII